MGFSAAFRNPFPMDRSSISPGQTPVGTLTPAVVKSRYFEFFPAGTHREVLLLGDLVEQYVHRVNSKGYNVLCGARAGRCEMCEKAAESDDVGIQRVEYYAPSFVRPWRDREFIQRVSVFSAAAVESILRLIPEGSQRGHRLDVERYSQGSSSRFRIKQLAGLPSGFPSMLPAAFDVVPFVLARYGKPAKAHLPMVFLPPFKCEAVMSGPAGRPRPLDLSADDCRVAPEDLAKMKSALGEFISRTNGQSDPPPPPPPPVTSVPAPTATTTIPAPTVTEPVQATSTTSMPLTPGPRKIEDPNAALEALRLRSIRNKPPEQLTAPEAVEVGRITDYLLADTKIPATIPFNGRHGKKGGAR